MANLNGTPVWEDFIGGVVNKVTSAYTGMNGLLQTIANRLQFLKDNQDKKLDKGTGLIATTAKTLEERIDNLTGIMIVESPDDITWLGGEKNIVAFNDIKSNNTDMSVFASGTIVIDGPGWYELNFDIPLQYLTGQRFSYIAQIEDVDGAILRRGSQLTDENPVGGASNTRNSCRIICKIYTEKNIRVYITNLGASSTFSTRVSSYKPWIEVRKIS